MEYVYFENTDITYSRIGVFSYKIIRKQTYLTTILVVTRKSLLVLLGLRYDRHMAHSSLFYLTLLWGKQCRKYLDNDRSIYVPVPSTNNGVCVEVIMIRL